MRPWPSPHARSGIGTPRPRKCLSAGISPTPRPRKYGARALRPAPVSFELARSRERVALSLSALRNSTEASRILRVPNCGIRPCRRVLQFATHKSGVPLKTAFFFFPGDSYRSRNFACSSHGWGDKTSQLCGVFVHTLGPKEHRPPHALSPTQKRSSC